MSNSKLGFGLMRLPKDAAGNILQEEVTSMVDAFMQSGMTYFDTAYAYAGSEASMKKALVDRYSRESFTIADKLPAWKLKSENDVERIFKESMELCGVEYFDFYLLHSVEASHLPTYENYHCFEFLQEMKRQGKIRYIGFSYHDNAELLDSILTNHTEIDFVQLQLNYLDWENGVIQSRKNYETARKHGKPVVVMEPVKGGTLASFPEDTEKIYKDYAPEKSVASWALRYIASLEGVMTVLSGMSNEEQMRDNLDTFVNFTPMNKEEYELVKQVTSKVLSFPTIPCTACRYCVPGCPMGIQIPDLFTAYNSAKTYGSNRRYDTYYKNHTQDGHGAASACIGCGQCEGVCPQHLEIISLLKDVSQEFEEAVV
ncbi:MAG: 4Fe-4S dicluster domain-containing protein [Hungatella sp.]|nr:4Fe-4S dicluster domain-containing protein [Hungatella sp.]